MKLKLIFFYIYTEKGIVNFKERKGYSKVIPSKENHAIKDCGIFKCFIILEIPNSIIKWKYKKGIRDIK